MDSFELTGKYRIEKGTTVKDPLVTIEKAVYDYNAMTVTLTVLFTNNQYSFSREMEPAPIKDTNGLSKEQIVSIVETNITFKKV